MPERVRHDNLNYFYLNTYIVGQSQPNIPPVKRAYMKPSNIDLKVADQPLLNQILFCNNAKLYPANAVTPANRKTDK